MESDQQQLQCAGRGQHSAGGISGEGTHGDTFNTGCTPEVNVVTGCTPGDTTVSGCIPAYPQVTGFTTGDTLNTCRQPEDT